MKAFNVQPPKPVRTARNKPAIRYVIVEHSHPNGDLSHYTIRRLAGPGWECWGGRELGWMPLQLDYTGKRFKRYGSAQSTLRKCQEADRAALSAIGRRRHIEKMAPQLLESLRNLVDHADSFAWERYGGVPQFVDEARSLIRIADRGY